MLTVSGLPMSPNHLVSEIKFELAAFQLSDLALVTVLFIETNNV